VIRASVASIAWASNIFVVARIRGHFGLIRLSAFTLVLLALGSEVNECRLERLAKLAISSRT
jgi:hypothetical protein